MKFKLWIEIQQMPYQKDKENPQWTISYSLLPASIYKEEFFIEGYPIDSYTEDSKTYYSQSFKANKKLHPIIQKLLLPKSKHNYFGVDRSTAWDYYHYTLYIGGFTFNVHPTSMSSIFLRVEFEGTQEEIYNKCLELNKKWISKNNKL